MQLDLDTANSRNSVRHLPSSMRGFTLLKIRAAAIRRPPSDEVEKRVSSVSNDVCGWWQQLKMTLQGMPSISSTCKVCAEDSTRPFAHHADKKIELHEPCCENCCSSMMARNVSFHDIFLRFHLRKVRGHCKALGRSFSVAAREMLAHLSRRPGTLVSPALEQPVTLLGTRQILDKHDAPPKS